MRIAVTVLAATTAVFAAATAFLAVRYVEAGNHIALLESQLEGQKTKADNLQHEAQEAAKTIGELRQQVASLHDAGEIIGGFFRDKDDEEATVERGGAPAGKGKADNPLAYMSKMFDGEHGAKMAEYSAGMMVDMAYGDFINQLKLPRDVEDRVREILRRNSAEQVKAGMNFLGTGFDKKKGGQAEQQARAQLRQELSQVLNADEMAQWDEYEDSLSEHVLSKSMDLQLSMMAPGLAQDNRELVRDTIVEEMMNLMNDFKSSDIMAGANMQVKALEQAQARIIQSGQLDDGQLAELERYVSLVRQQVEMITSMMKSMEPKISESGKSE